MPGADQEGGGPDTLEEEDGFQSTSPLPAMIGPYQVVGRLGGGSMADLFVAHKLSPFGSIRRAVIKRVKRSRTDYKHLEKMLIDEARATMCLEHPNVVSVIDIGEDDGAFYVAIEFIDGTDLRRVNTRLRQRREALPFELAVFIVADVLRGLHHAHTVLGADGLPLGIIHRDVNPANVLVSTSGHVKLADFGVVRMRERVQEKTEPGLVKGKYAYLAPEYIAGEDCTIHTDTYAAGVMLFELLTGRECFTGKTPYEVMWKIVNQGVPMYRLEREGVPDDLRRIVDRATSTAPERRYASAQDMANALEAWLMRSGRHATPWVLSVFFTRHRLYPEGSELRAPALPLAAVLRQDKLLPPPRSAPERMDTGQAVARQLESVTAARNLEPGALTPMPEIVELPSELELQILAPDLGDATTEATGPRAPKNEMTPEPLVERARATPTNPPLTYDFSTAPTPSPLSAASPFEFDVDTTLKPERTPSRDIRVETKQSGDTAWVEFSQEAHTSDSHNSPTIPVIKGVLEYEFEPNVAKAIAALEPDANQPTFEGFAHTGKLEDTPAVDVIQTITESELSGTLEFRCGLIWKRVQICRGSPMGITSNMGMELIGEHLVKARLITRRDLDQALASAERSGSLLTVKLLDLGLLSRDVLEEELGKNLSARLMEVLEWRWGTYEFREEPVASSDLLPRLDLEALLERARIFIEQRSAEEQRKEPSGEYTPQKKLKEALQVARSIASSTGKGRVDRVDPMPNETRRKN